MPDNSFLGTQGDTTEQESVRPRGYNSICIMRRQRNVLLRGPLCIYLMKGWSTEPKTARWQGRVACVHPMRPCLWRLNGWCTEPK
eukprot:6400394-Amphidinium_carterae.1